MKITICLIAFMLANVEAQFNTNLFLRFYCQNPSNSAIRNVCQQLLSTAAPRTTPRRLPATRRPTPPPTRRPTPPPTPPPRPSPNRGNSRGFCTGPSRRCTEGKLLADLFSVNFIAPLPSGANRSPSSGRGGSGVFPSGGRTGTSTSGNSGRGNVQTSGRSLTNSNFNFARPAGGQTGTSTFGINRPNPSGNRPVPGGRPTTGGGSQLPGRGGGRQVGLGIGTSTTGTEEPCQKRFIVDSRGRIIAGACVTNQTRPTQPPTRSSRFLFRSKRQFSQNFYEPKRDLLIMMDESGSVGYARFDKVKRIAAAIVRLLCQNIRVDPQHTRVAVTSFDSQVHFHIQLLSPPRYQYLDRDGNALADFIYRQIRYSSRSQGSTCLIDALEHAYSQALGRQYGGRRGQPYVEQDIILISDGCENCVRPSYYAHDRIRQITSFFISENIHVYVIGIGIREQCKDTLSLLAQGGKCFHFFYLTNWDYSVNEFLQQLEFPPQGLCLNTFEAAEGQCLSNFG